MNEMLREIEEDIRRERYTKMWNGFGKLMVGASIVIVCATIAFEVAKSRRQSQAMEMTAQFIKGVERMNIEDYKGAIAIFDELSKDNDSSYYGLAMMRKAQAQAALGDGDAAKKTYEDLAKRDDAFGSLGAIMSAHDKPIGVKKQSPFHFTQSEWQGWQFLQQSKTKEAADSFAGIYESTEAPFSQRQRMNEVLLHIAPDKLAEGKKIKGDADE